MRVLGLGGGLHDLAACLVEDGRIVRAVEQERLTRLRHACDHDRLTACFRTGDFDPWFVQQIESGTVPELGYCLDGEPLESLDAISHGTRRVMALWRFDGAPVLRTLRRLHGVRSHHLAHAASAFLVSPFEEALTLVVDSFGTQRRWSDRFETSSLWIGRDRALTPIRVFRSRRVATDATPSRWPDASRVCSLGVFYSDVTLSCGFRVLDAGKTMGLAPWGSDRLLADLRSYVRFADGGEIHVDPRYLLFLRDCERAMAPLRDEDRFAYQADLAHAAQTLLEEAVLHLVRFGCEQTGLRTLCLAGGVALNAVANARILEETPVERLYVQPAANDAGIAIGAAFHTYYRRSGRAREFVMEHAYLGREYSDAENKAALSPWRDVAEWSTDVCGRTAKLLTEGKLVAWFQGGSEFGPRALGNRSILADPRAKETWQRVNAVKRREWFRPFAPAVLERAQGEYFELNAPSPSMTIVGRVRPARRSELGAVTHVDGTARLQTVRRETNPRFHALLEAFAARSGLPVLLNTSFNVEGPIVETPADAVETFLRSELDVLVLGDWILRHPRRPAPATP